MLMAPPFSISVSTDAGAQSPAALAAAPWVRSPSWPKTRPLSLAFARKATKLEPAQTACQPGQMAEEGGGCADCPPDTFDHDRNPDTLCRPCGALTPHAPPRSTVCTAAESPGWSPALDAPLTARNDATVSYTHLTLPTIYSV